MGLSGFVLELLVPGLVAVFAGLLLGWEFGIMGTDETSSFAATMFLSVLLVAAYLAGIALRHMRHKLVPHGHVIYRIRLLDRWTDELPALQRRWLTEAVQESSIISPGEISLEVTDELVARMSQYQSAIFSDAWTERLFYHRNLARLSGNSLPSMVLLAIACSIGFANRAIDSDLAAVVYLSATGYVIVVGFSLRKAYERRHYAYLDALVRTDLAAQARQN